MSKSRWFILTLNNPDVLPEELWQRSQAIKGCGFMAGQLETGQEGTPHYQFVVWVKENVRCSVIKKAFPQAHIEIIQGTPEQAIAYCTKEETRTGEPFTFGELPVKRNSKTDWEAVFEAAKLGDMDNIPADIKVKHFNNLQKITKHFLRPTDRQSVCGLWLVGKPGQGKTHFARQMFAKGKYYPKLSNKWWDGYQNEEVVVLDDLDKKSECLGHHLKIWGDKWGFIGESKGGALASAHKAFVVTSNYHIEEIFGEDSILAEAIKRRFKTCVLWQDKKTGFRHIEDEHKNVFEPEVFAALLRSDYGLK